LLHFLFKNFFFQNDDSDVNILNALNFYFHDFSKDCVNWGLLPPATKQMREQSKLAKGRFTGDPSFEFEHVETKKVGEGEDATEEEETVKPTCLLLVYKLKHLIILVFI
jgi:hypothetical protein